MIPKSSDDNFPMILVRHGQAVHNTIRLKVSGRAINSPLTLLGKKQSESVAMKLRQLFPETSRICYSPAVRCRQTAQIIAQQFPTLKMQADPGLLEMDQGTFAGSSKLLVLHPRYLVRWILKRWDFRFDDGESFRQVADRMSHSIDDIRKASSGPVIIVGHGLAIRCLLARRRKWSVFRLLLTMVKNASFKVL